MVPVATRGAHTQQHVRLLGVPVDQRESRPARNPSGPAPRPLRIDPVDQVPAEVFPHQRDHLVVVDVAGHRHHHAFRGVAPDVEGMQLIPGHPRNRVHAADHRTPHRVHAEHGRQEDVTEHVLGIIVAHGDLLEHDVALDLDVRGGALPAQYDIGDQIHRQRQIGVQHMGVVAGVLLGGERVEFTTDRIDRLGYFDRGSCRSRLEQQMLEEVCGAGHGGPLIARTHAHPDADRCRPNRRDEFGDNPQTARQQGAPDGLVGCRCALMRRRSQRRQVPPPE